MSMNNFLKQLNTKKLNTKRVFKTIWSLTFSLIFLFSSLMTYSVSYANQARIPDKIPYDDHIMDMYEIAEDSASIDEILENMKSDYKNRYIMYVDRDYVLGEIRKGVYYNKITYMTDYGKYYTPECYNEALGASDLKIVITNITETADMKTIWNYLRQKGFNEIATAGIMGNMNAESGFLPNNAQNSFTDKYHITDNEYTQKVDRDEYLYGDYTDCRSSFAHDGCGYGIVQFTYYKYKEDLYDEAKSRGVSISNLDLQLDILWKYIYGYVGAMNGFTSITTSAVYFQEKYEKPEVINDETRATRAGYALSVYKMYAGNLIATGNGGEIYYFQGTLPKGFASTLYCGDSKYGSSTLKESGAGPTAIAMVSSSLATYIKPDEVASESSDYYVKGGGSKLDILLDVEKYGLKVTQIGKDTEKLDKALKEGKVAIAVTGSKDCGGVTGLFNRTSEQNFIVVFGYDDNGYLICADPDGLNYDNVENKNITLQFLKGEAVGGFFVYEPSNE